MSRRFASSCMLAVLLSTGCQNLGFGPPPPTLYQVRVHVTSDHGQAVEGAQLQVTDKTTGVTGPDGRSTLSIQGNEGEGRQISVTCPKNLTSPTTPIQLTLKHFGAPGNMPEFDVSCPSVNEVTVVALRALNNAGKKGNLPMANLPILYQGKEVARTDGSGAASVALRLPPGESFDLKFSTEGLGKIKPLNPVATFRVKDRDDIVPFEQIFLIDKPVVVAKPLPPKGPRPI